MATYSKELLSNSTNGQGVLVSGTGTTNSTLIHTAIAGTTSYDEVWIYATNIYNAPVKLTIEYGNNTNPNGNIIQTLPLQSGMILLISGLLLNNGLTIKCFSELVDKVIIYGYVNRITN